MAASSDAGPLIWLAKCGLLDMLKETYSNVMVLEAVYEETVARGLEGGFEDAQVIEDAVEGGWIKVCKTGKQFLDRVRGVEVRLGVELGEGERGAIALGLERGIPVFLTNDEDAYQVGTIVGLEARGVLYVLLRGVKEGYIDKQQAMEIIRRMLEEGLWLSPAIIHDFHEALDRL